MLVALVLVALVLLAAAGRRGGLAGAAALAAVSVLWLLVNGSAEGPVLWSVTSDHGLTATDLAGLTGLSIAAWRARQAWRGRRDAGVAAPEGTAQPRSDGTPPPAQDRAT